MTAFNGFSKELVQVFKDLKENNTKLWFDKHRNEYEESVLFPSREFVVTMGKRLRKIAPGVNAIPKVNQSLFRINRDTRFSKDKSPYKTCMGIWFWDGHRKRMECSGFYFHHEDDRLLIGAGIHMFPRPLLGIYREAVVDKKLGRELRKAVTKVTEKGYQVGGSHYKRVPRGFDESHSNAEFLLYNGLHAVLDQKIPQQFYSEAIIDYAFSHYKNMVPIHYWLKKALKPS
jgi:uncharacterized protein (TIGR02453 family)